jgi:hypothetical protein
MRKLFKSLTQGWVDLFTGAGYVAPPQPGNMANAPAEPSVVTGSYQFIIPQMFDGRSVMITDVPSIPPFGRDWGQYAVNGYGLSGLEGGGSTGNVPQPGPGGSLYYDSDTNQYYDLNLLSTPGT